MFSYIVGGAVGGAKVVGANVKRQLT